MLLNITDEPCIAQTLHLLYKIAFHVDLLARKNAFDDRLTVTLAEWMLTDA
jgi:hypothetical protein